MAGVDRLVTGSERSERSEGIVPLEGKVRWYMASDDSAFDIKIACSSFLFCLC